MKRHVSRVGISSAEDFELIDGYIRDLIFPCHLGILICGRFKNSLIERIKTQLGLIFDSFFFYIRNLGEYKFTYELKLKGVKEYPSKSSTEKFELHPTNKFYQILIDKRIKNQLDMIIAITDLPLYSSSNNDIIFLFGEVHLKHRCGVVSSLKIREIFYNRKKNDYLFELRYIKEFIHEIGHLILGTEHCSDDKCVMRFSKSIEEIDQKSVELCDKCELRLKKIREIFNF